MLSPWHSRCSRWGLRPRRASWPNSRRTGGIFHALDVSGSDTQWTAITTPPSVAERWAARNVLRSRRDKHVWWLIADSVAAHGPDRPRPDLEPVLLGQRCAHRHAADDHMGTPWVRQAG